MGLSACSKHGWLPKAACHPLRGVQHLEEADIHLREKAREIATDVRVAFRNRGSACISGGVGGAAFGLGWGARAGLTSGGLAG